MLDHPEHQVDPVRMLEVDSQCPTSPCEHESAVHRTLSGGWHPRSLQAEDLRAQVGQHHCAERHRAEPGELDYAESCEGPGPSTILLAPLASLDGRLLAGH